MPSPNQRHWVGTGLVFLALGAWAGVWHFFASQSPSSPFHVAFLPGPIRRFAFWTLALGLLLPVVAQVLPASVTDPGAQKRFGRWLLTGAWLKVVGLGLGAFWSVYGVQIIDPRPKSVIVMSLRLLGDGVLLVTMTVIATAWVRRGRQPS